MYVCLNVNFKTHLSIFTPFDYYKWTKKSLLTLCKLNNRQKKALQTIVYIYVLDHTNGVD